MPLNLKVASLLRFCLISFLVVTTSCSGLISAQSKKAADRLLNNYDIQDAQASPIQLNNTDYQNLIYFSPRPDLSNATENAAQRIILEYADYSVQQNLIATPSTLPSSLPPRIIIEYADMSFNIGLPTPETLNVTISPRIIIEYADSTYVTRTMLAGDLNGDGKVSLADLTLFAEAYGTVYEGSLRWNLKADIDGNGLVGLSDLTLLAQNYGKSIPQS